MKRSVEFPWVYYENEKMLCTLCVKFPDLTRSPKEKRSIKNNNHKPNVILFKFISQVDYKQENKVRKSFYFQNPFRYAQNAGFCIKYFHVRTCPQPLLDKFGRLCRPQRESRNLGGKINFLISLSLG